MGGYAIVLSVVVLTTFGVTPILARIAYKVNAIAYPTARSVHTKPMPLIGGIAMIFGLMAGLLTAMSLDQFDNMFKSSTEPLALILAAGVITFVGFIDDIREVSPPAKVAGQVLAGSIMSLLGLTMLYFRVPFASFDYIVLSKDIAPIFTIVAVVILANAINLIDGLNGLAAGICVIAGSALFLYSDRLFKAGLLEGSNLGPLIAIITVGLGLGFLPWNFFKPITFMGDSGALLLGLLMAACTISVGGRVADQFSGQTYFFYAPLFIPLVILGVPLADTFFSIIRRIIKKRSFSVADKDHMHHRLMRLGHGPRRTVVILWLWTALLSVIVLVPTYSNGTGNSVIPFAIPALGLILFAFFSPARNQVNKEDELARSQRKRSGLTSKFRK
ncbi:MAG: undecaprenyl/decaprenyl-phosphate alpha-N-acetylglucosaminyl 1-phosphate transferase [Acidimicrobiia bacterium]|nr:undecaprenyl/decaprenyl-phosphate alpha-N-acetylglucosaminyl 1-phosphate transferase [Acidimicrobiia bacterium]